MWHLHEAYAKEMARQRLADAAKHRLARQAASVRRWERVETFASRRLNRATVRMTGAYSRP